MTDSHAAAVVCCSGSCTVDEVDLDFAQVTDLRFEIRGQDNNFLDEFRLGDTYADVAIPEPILAPLLGLLLLRRR